MLKCDPRAFARCPYNKTCVSVEMAEFTEGSDCHRFNNIDRKNFLFANTPKGATGSAIMFSLLQTAIENGMDPYNYLTWLLRKAKNADLTDTETVQSLLPWNAVAEYQTQ